MKVLSIRQPWASLIITGKKRCENRSWRHIPKIRDEWVAVHSSQKPEDGEDCDGLPLGAIVGAMLINHCCLITDVPKRWRKHHHTFGPVCLLIDKVVRIEPYTFKGRLGFWTCPIQAETLIWEAEQCLPS